MSRQRSIRHPKGENKWERQRHVWVDPVAYPFLTRYLQTRNDFVERRPLRRRPLSGGRRRRLPRRQHYPHGQGTGGGGDWIRLRPPHVQEAYGQRLIDRGIGINVVSKVLGHNSTNTTERYYCRLDDMDAVMTVAKALSAGLPGPGLPGESPDSSAGDRPQEFESINGVTDTDTECPPLGGE